jgi:hypothetical protein
LPIGQDPGQDSLNTLYGSFDPKFAPNSFPSQSPHPLPATRVCQERLDCSGKRLGIPRWDEQAGLVIEDDLGQGAVGEPDHRQTHRHGFQVDKPERFRIAWVDEDIQRRQGGPHILKLAGEDDPVPDPEV